MTSKTLNFFNLNFLLPFSVMDRYLARELLLPFLFGVGAFSAVGVSIDTVFALVRKVVESGLPLSIALNIFLLKLPEYVVLSFPMSALLATLMTYSRLSRDSELIMLRGFGISVYRMVLTAVVLGFAVTAMTFVFNEQIAPAANYQATVMLDNALKSDKPAVVKQRNRFYLEYQKVKQKDGSRKKILTRLFYADELDGKQMKGLTMIDRSQDGLNQIVVSELGEWNPSKQVWDFSDGTIYLVSPDNSYRSILRFERQQLELPSAALDLTQKNRDYDEMNITQGFKQLKTERQEGNPRKIRQLEMHLHKKIALPFVCVIFSLVGATMGTGTLPQQTGQTTSFGITIAIIFIYYLVSLAADTLIVTKILSPFLGAWLPNLLGLLIGIFLLMRVARR
ncbi:MAG: LptF/LptG family permease [Scytonema sp. PMC 1069.18]|nr:LptF/LptG family permease [Scytonema sp. PMC 1069.18]MEC4886946.1 LptF/LptG family permease [Scytonema sp. PMC 1070.18]